MTKIISDSSVHTVRESGVAKFSDRESESGVETPESESESEISDRLRRTGGFHSK